MLQEIYYLKKLVRGIHNNTRKLSSNLKTKQDKTKTMNPQKNRKSVTELEKLFHRIQEYVMLSPNLKAKYLQIHDNKGIYTWYIFRIIILYRNWYLTAYYCIFSFSITLVKKRVQISDIHIALVEHYAESIQKI